MKIGSFLLSVIVANIFGIGTLLAQFADVTEPQSSMSGMMLDRWTYKDGLASNNVNSIFQDHQDFIWLTSYNGILRFDGVEFTKFGPENVPVITSSAVYRVYEDVDSTLWFTTEASGLVGYKEGNFFSHPANDLLPKGINCVLRTSSGDFWVGTNNEGLYKYTKGKEVINVSGVPAVTVIDLKEDEKGSLWVATQGKGLYKIWAEEVTTFTQSDGLLNDVVLSLFVGNKGILYVGTPTGLCIVEDDKISVVESLRGLQVEQVLSGGDDTMWIATAQGLVKTSTDVSIKELYTDDSRMLGRRTTSLCFDKEGSLWIGTYKSGLLRLKPGKISNITSYDGLSFNHVNMIHKKDKKYYIGTEDGRVNIFDEKTSSFQEGYHTGNVGVRDVLVSPSNGFWIGGYKGLFKVDQRTRQLKDMTEGLPSHEVRRIFEDSQKKIWIGTRSGGLACLQNGKVNRVFDKNSGMTSNYVLSIDEGNEGNIIVGTHSGGLIVISPSGDIMHYNVTQNDSGLLIFNVTIDDTNNLWLATNLGLFYYNWKEFKQLNIAKDLGHNKFFDVVNDNIGGTWLTSDIGIVRVNTSDALDAASGQMDEIPFALYNESDGMANRECTGATRSFFDQESGEIWIPTLGGIAIVDPALKLVNNRVPNVFITGLTVDGQGLDVNNPLLEVQPGSFRFAFNFTALSFLVPSRVKFRYKLEGIDQEWRVISGSRHVEYTNLPYGSYELKVKGSNGQGTWNENGDVLSFEVLPFFYETKRFAACVIGSLALILWALYHWRIGEIKDKNVALTKINNELDNFVYRASHDLRTPVTSTLSLTTIALNESSVSDKDEYIKLIDQCAKKLDHIILDIIEYSRNKNKELEYENFSARELVEEILNEVSYAGNKDGIQFNMEIEEELLFSDKSRLRIILSNFIANSIQYIDNTKANPFVNINISESKEHTTISVEDNGVGIPRGESAKIFNMFYRGNHKSKGSGLGLYIVNETAKKLSGVVSVASEIGVGSTFSLTIPKRG